MYAHLTTDELEQEQERQLKAVSGASPSDRLDELQKLFVIEGLLSYREALAARWEQRREAEEQPKPKAKPKPRQKDMHPRPTPGRNVPKEMKDFLFGKVVKSNPAGH